MKEAFKRTVNRLTATQLVISGYFAATILSSLLLILPISLKPGASLTLIDALFTATSAVSVTGLTAVNTAETFSLFGTIVLLFLFQLGGIGIMSLGTFLWILLGRNISLSYRKMIMIDQNQHQLSGLVQLMRLVFGMTLLFEAAGTMLFSVYFYAAGYFDKWYECLYYGLFHAVSSFTNAGFDIFGSSSVSMFANDYFVQSITILLLILGAIGFPVLIELREYLFGKHDTFRFSLYTKVTVIMFFLLIALGALGIWMIENRLFYADLPWHEKMFYSLFNSVTTRSGGLATMDVSQFSSPTQFVLSILMFIGASPSSVGGGIRTTTFAVILVTIITYSMGKSEVRLFRRAIKQEDIIKSLNVFAAAIMLVIASIVALDIAEKQSFTLMEMIFEISSAFGTSGLSMGITGELSPIGKVIIILLMFLGRIGVLSLIYMYRTEKRKESVHYPKEDIIIG